MSANLNDTDYELLSAYLDDMLEADARHALEQRLQADSGLQQELDALRQTVALVRGLPKLKAPRDFTLTPAMLEATAPEPPLRVVPKTQLATTAPPSKKIITMPWVSLMSAAASLILMIAGIILLTSTETEPVSMAVPETDMEVALYSNVSPVDATSLPTPTIFQTDEGTPIVMQRAIEIDSTSTMQAMEPALAQSDTQEGADGVVADMDDNAGGIGGATFMMPTMTDIPADGGDNLNLLPTTQSAVPGAVTMPSASGGGDVAAEAPAAPLPLPSPAQTLTLESASESASAAALRAGPPVAESALAATEEIEATGRVFGYQTEEDPMDSLEEREGLPDGEIDVTESDDMVGAGAVAKVTPEERLLNDEADDENDNQPLGIILVTAGSVLALLTGGLFMMQRRGMA